MKTLYLIDGYAQFFRNYHAIRTPMTSPVTKEPTNMTFGFVGMLLKLLRGEGNLGGKPDYFAVALDVSGDRGTFRSRLYPEYKANRDEPPDDLFPQVERCLDLLKAIGVPVIGCEGFEADDVIAAIVKQLQPTDVRTRIVSKDKDLKQLLDPNKVEMFDVHTDEIIDAARLMEDTGLEPSQVGDMLALMGDTADNIPGVPGIGPKTAAQLIAHYGTLDAVLADADNIKGKRGQNIRSTADALPLSKTLVTLRDDIETDFDLDAADTTTLDLPALMPILKELGFGRYQDDLKELLGIDQSDAPRKKPLSPSALPGFGGLFDSVKSADSPTPDADYRCVRTTQELDELVAKLEAADVVAFDTETTSLSPVRADLCGLSFAIEPGSAWYVPVRSPEPDTHLDERTVLDALRPLLEDESKPKIGHNLKYDLLVLRRAGVAVRGFENPGSCDSMIASYVLDASRSSHSLDALALALLHHSTISIKELIGTGKSQRRFDEVPLAQASPYAAEDADITLQLARVMHPQIRDKGFDKLFHDLEMPLVPVLGELEWNGIEVNPHELDRQRESLEAEISNLKSEIANASFEAIGREFDPDSPKQLSGALFNRPDADEPGMGLKPIKKIKTGYSTNAEVLDKLDADPDIDTPLPGLIIQYRRLTKLVNTYLVALKDAINPETGRIHASFNQTVAVTGRLSSSDPNLQNVPIRTEVGREIRKAFVAPPGRVLISADYSQIELRLLAHLSRDPALIEAFLAGADIHRSVAAEVHGIPIDEVTDEQRNGAKMVNFGIIYGVTPFGLARRLDVSNTEAGEIIGRYKKRFAGITTFLEECVAQATRFGYVETMMGRRRPIPDITSNNPQRRALAERTAINTVVQGSAADLIKLAMIDIHRRIKDANPASPSRERLDLTTSPLREQGDSSKSPERERRGIQPSPRGEGGPRCGPGEGIPAPSPLWGEGGPRSGSGEGSSPLTNVLMLLQIHDELVFEADESNADGARALIVDRMEHAMQLDVPLVVDSAISTNWFEGK